MTDSESGEVDVCADIIDVFVAKDGAVFSAEAFLNYDAVDDDDVHRIQEKKVSQNVTWYLLKNLG